jgi:hypothetical protein
MRGLRAIRACLVERKERNAMRNNLSEEHVEIILVVVRRIGTLCLAGESSAQAR